MERVDITLNLPQELVNQAKSAGLLTPKQIEQMLMDELERQRRLDRFFGKLDLLASSLTQEEIDGEIALYQQEKRSSRT